MSGKCRVFKWQIEYENNYIFIQRIFFTVNGLILFSYAFVHKIFFLVSRNVNNNTLLYIFKCENVNTVLDFSLDNSYITYCTAFYHFFLNKHNISFLQLRCLSDVLNICSTHINYMFYRI